MRLLATCGKHIKTTPGPNKKNPLGLALSVRSDSRLGPPRVEKKSFMETYDMRLFLFTDFALEVRGAVPLNIETSDQPTEI